MLEKTTKTIKGEERDAMRWGPDGTVYVCDSDGDCTSAARRALEWAIENGVPAEEVERAGTLLNSDAVRASATSRDERRRRMLGRGRGA